jgi:hypothetical protein
MIAVLMEYRKFSTEARGSDDLAEQELNEIDEFKMFSEKNPYLSQESRRKLKNFVSQTELPLTVFMISKACNQPLANRKRVLCPRVYRGQSINFIT